MVDPVTLRTVPLGIWLRNRPPPEAATLLRSVMADSNRAEVALLLAMPPPSAAFSPSVGTKGMQECPMHPGVLGQAMLTNCDVGCEGRPADGLLLVVCQKQATAIASRNIGRKCGVGDDHGTNPAVAP